MVIVFALFLGRAIPSFSAEHVLYAKAIFGIHFEFTRGSLVAILSVLLLTAVNVRSVKLAAWLQNLTAHRLPGRGGDHRRTRFRPGAGILVPFRAPTQEPMPPPPHSTASALRSSF